MTEPGSPALRLPESNRVEAFSDGIFAIALTLLVLDLHAPGDSRGRFAHVLVEQWPAYLAYLAAFLNIASINHHDLFTRVRAVDARLICANLFLLLVASLFPWPASVISAAVQKGDHGDQVAAMVLYAAVGFLVPLAWILLYGYLARTPYLLRDASGVAFARRGRARLRRADRRPDCVRRAAIFLHRRGAVRCPGQADPVAPAYGVHVRDVPWWGVVSSAAAPVLLIGAHRPTWPPNPAI